MLIKENQSIESLILGACRHLALHSEVLKKRHHLSLTQATWVCIAHKRTIPRHPTCIGALGAYGVAPTPNLCHQRVKRWGMGIPPPDKTHAARLCVGGHG